MNRRLKQHLSPHDKNATRTPEISRHLEQQPGHPMAKEWPILFFLAAALMQVRSAMMQTVSQFACFAFETADGTSHRLLAAAAHQGPSPRASVGEARGAAMNRGCLVITRFFHFQ